jgi:ABC-type antimicrobial peptide transport system permease subunit
VGANRSQVLRMVLTQAVTLAGVGIAAGIVAALMLTQLMQSLLYEVRPADPITFITVTAALVVVALLAGAFPAYRATRVSPMIALRTE